MEWKLTFSSPVAAAEFSKFAGILSAAQNDSEYFNLMLLARFVFKLLT